MQSGNTRSSAEAAGVVSAPGRVSAARSLMGSLATRNYLLACVKSLPGVTAPSLLFRQRVVDCCSSGDVGKCASDTYCLGVCQGTCIGLVLKIFAQRKDVQIYETIWNNGHKS